jgi:hypothetical protein
MATKELEKHVRIYGDESGNDGIISTKQPLFVYALVPLNVEQEAGLKAHLRAIRGKEKLTEDFEFHHVKMIGSSVGLRRIREIGEFFLAHDVPILTAIMEKRFMLCAMIVETYLDPEYNPAAPPENEPELRQWIANSLYDMVDDSTLGRFFEASRTGDVVVLEELGRALAMRISMHPDNRIARLSRVFERGSKSFFRFGVKTCDEPRCVERMAPVAMAFLPLLRNVDLFLGERNLRGTLVLDEDLQFGHAKEHALNIGRDPGQHRQALEEFGMKEELKNVIGSSESKSETSDCIQLADIAAGIVGRIVGERLWKPKLEDRLLNAWKPFQVAIARTLNHFLAASEKSLGKRFLSP